MILQVNRRSRSAESPTDCRRARRVLDEAEVNELLTPAQRLRLRQIALQAEGPGAFSEPEVVSELNLTPEQRDQIRFIQEEAIFGWMKGRPGKANGHEKTTNERLLAVLTEDQVRLWKAMTGEPAKFPIAPFGAPVPKGK